LQFSISISWRVGVLVWAAGAALLNAQLPGQGGPVTGATFGTIVSLGGTPGDVVVDELRGRLYLVNSPGNRVDVYNYNEKRITGSITVGQFPISAAMSMDGAFLYVTNVTSSTLTQIELGTDRVVQHVGLPAKPEGVAVGADGRVLITTQGAGVANTSNTLLLFDGRQESAQQLAVVPAPPPITTPNPLPAVFAGRPATAFPGRLMRTPDGNFIIGMVAINQTTTAATTTLFVYEVASGTVLRNRFVTGQSTVLSISPDGARFMAGSTQYDTATLNVVGQMSVANLPFFLNNFFSNQFNIQFNFGGSVFSADGATLYSAFNNTAGNGRPVANVLMIGTAGNLGVRLGIKMPESILGKIVSNTEGTLLWALSESGVIQLPIATLFDYPILMPDASQVFLANDECNKGIARAVVRVGNLGKGKLTYSVPNTGSALVAQITSGVAPSNITFVQEPGRAGVTRQAGTNLYTGSAFNTGFPVNVVLASLEAINLPNVIRVYMNFRQPDQRGQVYPVPTTPAGGEGLWDLLLDEPRGRLYLTNSGYNRIEVFDLRKGRFIQPIETGQLPHVMAMSLDGSTLYVANTGGENIQSIDLETGKVTGQIIFPPIPRAGNTGLIRPWAMAMGLSGLQFIMSNGFVWKVTGDEASPRAASNLFTGAIGFPQYMSGSAGGEYVVAMSGTGVAYLYDGLLDSFTSIRAVYTQPPISYFGPLAAGPLGSFHLAGGQILSSGLSPVGGSERPGVTQFGPPPGPGQPPTQTIVSAGQRNVASVYPMSESRFVRLTTPVRQNITVATRDDPRTTLEVVDIRTQAESVAGIVPENPVTNVFGAQRANIGSRQMVTDSKGTVYAITISGLSVIPTTPASTATQPRLPNGARNVVNSTDGTAVIRPGSFVTITGLNLAGAATADQLPAPTVLGGTCVTFNDVPLPLLQTSPTQISAQIPATVRPGQNVVQVRSLATAQYGDPVVVGVTR